jgi:hypothetical protein
LALGCAAAALVHVVQHNINQDVCRVVHAGALEGQGPELLGEPVPAKELPEVNVANLEGLYVLEHVEGDRRVEGELLIALDEPRAPVRRQPQARDFCEGGIQVLEVGLDRGLLLFCSGGGYA